MVDKNGGPSATTTLQIYKQSVKPIFKDGIVYNITVSDTVIHKIKEFRALSLGQHLVSQNMSQPPYNMKPLDIHTSRRDLSLWAKIN